MEMLELHQRNISVSIHIADQTTDVYATVDRKVMVPDSVQNAEEVVDVAHADP
jgi:hypothetical protein